jgi:hypothetical protein
MEAGVVKQNGPEEPPVPSEVGRGERHRLFGALKCTTFISPGVDLTEPADPNWADISEEISIPPAQR